MVLNKKEVTEFAPRNLEKEKNSEFYPPLERIERKLDAIIDWINRNVKEGMVVGTGAYGTHYVFFERVPTIDIEDCERRDKDSQRLLKK